MKQQNPNQELMEELFTFYRNIKRLREQLGLSTKEFADIIEISEKKLILSNVKAGFHPRPFKIQNLLFRLG